MHIFFITQWFPSAKYPIYGVFILEHAKAVSRMHKVSLLNIRGVDQSLAQPIQVTPEQVQPNLTIYHLSYRHPIIPFTSWLRKYAGAYQVFSSATKQFGHPDVIHANVNNTAGVSVLLGLLANNPIVMSEFSSAYGRKLFMRWRIPLMRFLMNRIDLIMPDSAALSEHIRAYGIRRPMKVVHNVVDTDLFSPAAQGEQVTNPQREIAIIARLSKEKAVQLAIQVLCNLHAQGKPVRLHIAGDGEEREQLEALVRDLNLTEWVIFHGFQPKSELARLLRQSSVFLLTSLWESKPVVILEALSCGLPVVAPALGGIPEVITPTFGMLFKPGDLDDLTSKLGSVLSRLDEYDPQAIRKYAVDNFSQAAVGKSLNEIYQQICTNRHAYENSTHI